MKEHLAQMGKNWGWFFSVGLASIVLGVLAFNWPISSTVSLMLVIGALLIANGFSQVVQAVQLHRETGNGWRIFHAFISLVAGFLMLRFPAAGMQGVAIVMAFYFFLSASAKAILALNLRGFRGWGWGLLSAIISFGLGIYIVVTFPMSSIWVPGAVLGVDFFVYGLSLMGFSYELKRLNGRIKKL